ncbi:MAG TPA: hypothetical protein VFH68_22010 [Polyangia bacterium]|jgi:hypothetical protein|nr:hypothetical protein [Polyangia bacterium]
MRWFDLMPKVLPLLIALGPGEARAVDDAGPAKGKTTKREAKTAIKTAGVRHRPDFPVMGLVGLAGDRFIIWNGAGQMQVGSATGEWAKGFRLPISQIGDVVADGVDFLVDGSVREHVSAVLLVNVEGRELARWTMADLVYGLVVDARGRWASTRAGLIPLLEGGALGTPEPLTGSGPSPYGDPPKPIRADGGAMVTCRPRDLSMQHGAPGRCDRSGPREWHLRGDFFLPVACGDWLVAVEGARPWQLVVYSLATGKRAMKRPDPVDAVVACADPGDVLVGDRRLSLLRLPEGKPVWTARLAGAPITQLAVTENAVAYRADDSPDIVIIPRPRERSR